MRNKIRQLMKKEEGFTLVELLAVIVILGIILAIAVPQIGNVISRARSGASEAEQELVIDAARLYMIDNAFESGTVDLDVDGLVDDGYLEETASDNINGNDYVEVTANTGSNGAVNYTYEFKTGTTTP